jgi:hypothetical protein
MYHSYLVNEEENKMTISNVTLINNGLHNADRVKDCGFTLVASNGEELFLTDAMLDALIKARREERKQKPAGYLFLLDGEVADSITKYAPNNWTHTIVQNIRPLYED